jgi:hypothetical protein
MFRGASKQLRLLSQTGLPSGARVRISTLHALDGFVFPAQLATGKSPADYLRLMSCFLSISLTPAMKVTAARMKTRV